jgi:hypothetical protein
MKKIISLLAISVGFMLMFSSCDNAASKENNKPKARGAIGEIVLAVDSVKWNGPLGDALKDVFLEDIKGLIREEALFTIRRVDPRAMNNFLKMATNIVFVTTFDDKGGASQNLNRLFTKEAKEQAAKDPNLYLLRSENEFAKGQEVIYLFGNTEAELIENLNKNKQKIQNLFQVRERNRLASLLLARKNPAAKAAGKPLGLDLNIPASYQVVKAEENFLWLRQPTPTTERPDVNLFFYTEDYLSEEQAFPQAIIELRERITKAQIFGDPDNKNSFVTLEKVDPAPIFNTIKINGNFAVEIRGGWKTNNISMGGSFLAYNVVDDKTGRMHYMEGFVFYPNEAHRESIREVEAILHATQTLPKNNK